jgi:hypothetical protein
LIERASSVPSALREAFRALARRGWVLPPGLLVAALTSPMEAPETPSVLGARGRWLASMNPAWRWAVAGDSPLDETEAERTWNEGTKRERITLVRRLRSADPAAARERIAAVFPTEPADVRQDLVRALEVGLSPTDEQFLQAALDDRSKGVREAAAELLPRLPRSAFVDRMVTQALASQDALAGAVPILCSIPASVLERRLDTSPETIVEAVDRSSSMALLEAWRRTAAPEERATLLPRLWDIWWTKPLQRSRDGSTLVKLAADMPADLLWQRMLRLLEDPPEATEPAIGLVLSEMDAPWPADVSRAVLGVLRGWLDRTRRKDRNPGDWARLILPLALHASHGTMDETLDLMAEIERAKMLPAWNGELRQGAEALRMRRKFWDAMSMALMESTSTTGVSDDRHE